MAVTISTYQLALFANKEVIHPIGAALVPRYSSL
jgi:hypothetical protein